MLALRVGGQVGAQAHADHAAEELGQAAHDDDPRVAERGEARGEGEGDGQAVGEADDDVAHDGLVAADVFLDVGSLRGGVARRHAVDRRGAQTRRRRAATGRRRVGPSAEEGRLG